MKAYRRKQVTSLKSLEKEQQKLKKLSRQVEQDWSDVLNPQSLLSNNILPFLFKQKGKRKNESTSSSILSMLAGININQRHPLWKTVASLFEKEQTKSFAKAVGKSFLRWQAFNLAWWLSGKIYTAVKNKTKPNT